MAGETGPIDVSLTIAMLIAGFFAIAVYNTVEIGISIFVVFRRKQGLYFWSLITATLGILIHTIAVFLRFFALAPNLPMCVVTVVGWWAMVTGQSVVLYSRLGLVVQERWKTRLVGTMIVLNFFILHVPVSILFLASNSGNPDLFIGAFDVYEKIQLFGFFLQESIISGLYMWEAATNFKPILAVKATTGRRVLRHLVILFVLTVMLDASLLATEYTNNFQIQTTYKPVVYSMKLKIEFVILNELIAFTQAGRHHDQFFQAETDEAGRSYPSAGAITMDSPSTISRFSTQHGMGTKLKKMKTFPADALSDRRGAAG